jgi:ERCC4-type nuclease
MGERMILIDSRIGSAETAKLFKLPALTVMMDYGDYAFIGSGPNGDILIGIERKQIGDLLNSITSGRLAAHQLPGLLSTYDVVYLIVEGVCRADHRTGELLSSKDGGKTFSPASFGKRPWTMEAMHHHLTTLEVMCGIHVRGTRDAKSTVKTIEYLWSWFNKPYEKHNSHLALHKGMNFKAKQEGTIDLIAAVEKPSLVRRIGAELPAVGLTRSLPLARRFKTLKELFEASEKDLLEVEGFGKVTSRLVYDALHGEKIL